MSLQKFTMESLATIDDGRIKVAFEQMLHDLIQDCHDRPEHDGKRKLTLTITLTPSSLARGELETIDLGFDLKTAAPKLESRTYNMSAKRGGLAYNEMSPDEARQRTFDDVGPRADRDDTPAGSAPEVADVG